MKKFRMSGDILQLSDLPMGEGRAGNVFEIVLPEHLSDRVVKVYDEEPTEGMEQVKKIKFMIKNPPEGAQSPESSVVWPIDLAYGKDGFVGCVMPMAKGFGIEPLCLPCQYSDNDARWAQFCRCTEDGLLRRLKICVDVADAVNRIHNTGKYVIADLKPDNILVSDQGSTLVSAQTSFLVGLDSVQVHTSDTFYPGSGGSSDYLPPEVYQHNRSESKNSPIPVSSDSFSMAVIFYRLLFGIHPYTGTTIGKYARYTSTAEKIQHGLFPFGSMSEQFGVIPPLHINFRDLGIPILQQLFQKSFTSETNDQNHRPTALEWRRALTEAVEETGRNHYNYPHPTHGEQIQQKSYRTSPKTFPTNTPVKTVSNGPDTGSYSSKIDQPKEEKEAKQKIGEEGNRKQDEDRKTEEGAKGKRGKQEDQKWRNEENKRTRRKKIIAAIASIMVLSLVTFLITTQSAPPTRHGSTASARQSRRTPPSTYRISRGPSRRSAPPAALSRIPSNSYDASVIIDRAYLLRTPGSDLPPLAQVRYGDKVKVLDRKTLNGNGNQLIVTDTGQVTNQNESLTVLPGTTLYILADSGDYYIVSRPLRNGEFQGKILKSKVKQEDWSRVQTANREAGWIKSSDLSIEK